LLKNGADVQVKDKYGKRAIDYAKENEKLKDTDALRELEQVVSRPAANIADEESKTGTTIKVSNAREFLEALGSDRVIEMAPGVYVLSDWDPYYDGKEGTASLPSDVRWDGETDGGELRLNGISKLTIRGSDRENVRIVVHPRYSYVLKFENCEDIAIENLQAGHSEGGFCSGGVFAFADSSRISITGVGMYGCGTEGLGLYGVSDMTVTDSSIFECTYAIMTVSGGSNIAFEKCVFRDNKEYWLVNVDRTRNISFADCDFTGNQGRSMFEVSEAAVFVSGTTFSGNDTESPIQGSENVEFTNCVFD
jgi:hypothetical protein